MAWLARIAIYPIKSLDPLQLEQTTMMASGALWGDRRFAIVDRQGDAFNGKRTPAMHRLRTQFDPQLTRLTIAVEGSAERHTFEVNSERRRLEAWLSEYLHEPVALIENDAAGFPDDVESPGPTVISTATLAAVAGWFPGMAIDEARLRFRANLEIDGVEPFWEDRLAADSEVAGGVPFRIGQAELLGTNPCQRCAVPSRHPRTGEPLREFAKTFARRRQEMLPAWAPAARLDHYYRLATNTRPAAAIECLLKVGDPVVCAEST